MGLRKGPILPIALTNDRYKTPVKNREVQLSSAGSDDCRRGIKSTYKITYYTYIQLFISHL